MKILSNFIQLKFGRSFPQSELRAAMRRGYLLANPELAQSADFLSKLEKFTVSDDVIGHRSFVNEWFLTHDWAANPTGPGLKSKMKTFTQHVNELVEKAYDGCESPSGMVHVSCSGYVLPSAVQRLVSKKDWRDVSITHSYHMGCYGAFPGIKIGAGLPRNSSKRKHQVDIVHTELFSSFFDPKSTAPDNLLAFSLFGDGAIKYSIIEDPKDLGDQAGLRIVTMMEEILPNSIDDMAWGIGDYTFEVYLAKDIPFKIGAGINGFVQRLCQRAEIDFDKEKDNLEYAIHPGGTKILEEVASELGIERSQLYRSFDVLKAHGNMSSVSVPVMLKAILDDPTVRPGTKVVAVGFGPGLTAAGLVLEKIVND